MVKKIGIMILFVSVVMLTGCETVNRGAEKVGKTGGKVMRVPHSVSEGAAEGIAGEPESNPYGR